jgi:hypothetical protein
MSVNQKVSDLASLLTRRYREELLKPFPYEDCFKILDETGHRFEALIPDLDMYFYDIASPCSAAKRLICLPIEERTTLQKRLQGSFYEKHPEYQEIEFRITPVKTPYLYAHMAVHEEIRVEILRLLFLLTTA